MWQWREISSISAAYVTWSRPAPPYSVGTMPPAKPSSPGLLHELPREALVAVVVGDARGDLPLRPLAREGEEGGLLVGETEVHGRTWYANQTIVW